MFTKVNYNLPINQIFPYRSFSSYLRQKYAFPVFKATIDAGFICPNMDGSKGLGGCTFCNNASFSPAFSLREQNIYQQIDINISKILKKRFKLKQKNPHFIAYFQAFSGTYGSVETLKSWYQEALSHPQIIGLSVGTRPDCLTPQILSLFENLADQNQEIWLEIGVESTHNETLKKINRGHTYEETIAALQLIKKIPKLKLCVHLIYGLPGETPEMMIDSVKKINTFQPDAIKFHHLEIVKDTLMEKQYKEGKISVLSLNDSLNMIENFLPWVHPEIIVQRFFSSSPSEFLIAPLYETKTSLYHLLINHLSEKNIQQGSKWTS